MHTILKPRTVLPPKKQQNFAKLLEALSSEAASICDRAGHVTQLPEEVRDAFLNVATAIAEGRSIQLVPHRIGKRNILWRRPVTGVLYRRWQWGRAKRIANVRSRA
ncbi:MAG: hypothetical protein K2Q25_11500 [Mycobacteriaceae bacterium]|nr:hypothetical protein [Mycobacteriaceae bacterium]